MTAKKWFVLYIFTLFLISGCGVDNVNITDNGGESSSVTLIGIAASGAALAGANVSAKDVNGTERSVTTDVNGFYELNLSDTEGPYVIRVITMSGAMYYSAALSDDIGGTINITPLTSIIVADATDTNLRVLYDDYGIAQASMLTENLADSITHLVAALTPVATAVGATLTEAGLLRGAFVADHTGIDRVLDSLHISFIDTVLTITDKLGNVITSSDMASSSLVIDEVNVSSIVGYLAEYANATAEIADFLAILSSDCGNPVFNVNNLNNDDIYTNTCTDHLAPADTYLNEGVSNPAEFAPGWWNIAVKNGSVVFSNPVIFGYDAAYGYKVRYNYVATAANRMGLFQSEGYFKKIDDNEGSWMFFGDQQYLHLDLNAHRYIDESSTNIDANAFKLFVGTGASSWEATIYQNEPITYVIVTGSGLPASGVTLSQQISIDGQPFLMSCMPIKGNLIEVSPQFCSSSSLANASFTRAELIAPEGQPGNMQRYIIKAYTGTVGAGSKLYEVPYWLPLRYEYVIGD